MKHKNILDEMQEQKRLQIESNGLWIAFFGLTAIIIMKSLLYQEFQFRMVVGEFSIILILAIYLIPNYIKYGIWSTRRKPTFQSNLCLSILAGLVVGLPKGITTYFEYHKPAGSIATAIFMIGSTCALCMALLTLCTRLYNNHIKKLENVPEDTPEDGENAPQK